MYAARATWSVVALVTGDEDARASESVRESVRGARALVQRAAGERVYLLYSWA